MIPVASGRGLGAREERRRQERFIDKGEPQVDDVGQYFYGDNDGV
jgi:hypothetical protein